MSQGKKKERGICGRVVMGAPVAQVVRAPAGEQEIFGSNHSLGTNFSLNIYHLYVGQYLIPYIREYSAHIFSGI